MNQQCKVCGEPAAGFHFGAFTCEGCKSFFGRSYNNLSSITDCKNNNECIINKKNRTACKACRLKKCIVVGMSKSGSRYGRRSNWFKIHCLLQEQQQQAQQQNAQKSGAPHTGGLGLLGHPPPYSQMFPMAHCSKDSNMMMLSVDDYKHASTSPSVSSPDSHNSDSSVEVGDRRQHILRHKPPVEHMLRKDFYLPLSFPNLASLQGLPPPGTFLPPPSAFTAQHLLFPGGYHPALFPHQGLLKPANNNNNHTYVPNHNVPLPEPTLEKMFYLDAILKSQRSPSTGEETEDTEIEETRSLTPPQKSPSPIQDNPIDLSMKAGSSTSDERHGSPGVDSDGSEDNDREERRSRRRSISDVDADEDTDYEREVKRLKNRRTTPLDLTTKV